MKGLNNPIGIKSSEPSQSPFITNPYRFGGAVESFDSLHGDTSLKAYYKFDEASGDIVNQSIDSAKIANSNLTVTGATYGATGVLGDALHYDGVDDKTQANNSALADWNFLHNNNAEWSVAMWVSHDDFSASHDIFSTQIVSGSYSGFLVRVNANRTVKLWLGQTNGDLFSNLTGTIVPNDTDFHFLYMSYSDSAGTFKISIDDGSVTSFTGHNLTNATNCQYRLKLSSASGSFHKGKFDEVSIWGKILTATEITDLYNGGSGRQIYD